MSGRQRPRAAIVGLSGTDLTAAEVELFQAFPPAGLILFARNIDRPDQLRALTDSARTLLGEDLPILVDQEGGRVARLRAPHWPAFPSAKTFEGLPEDAAEANAALVGLTCRAVGIDVVCAPVLDLRLPGAHAIIGDRAFSADPAEVVRLGRAWIAGLQAAGCIPVVKHIPGHGRAQADSHEELPRVAAGRDTLALDCAPFAALAGTEAWAMTAHLLYESLDPQQPATLSPQVIDRVIRRAIGFDGVLISDDLAMRALSGTPGRLAEGAVAAGCDLALHCTGVFQETAEVLAASPDVTEIAAARIRRSRAAAEARRDASLDIAALIARRDAHLAAAA